MPIYVYIILLTLISSCGLLGSEEDGGLLTVTPVSAVEVVLKVNAQPGADIAITRDGTELFSFTMEGTDTLLIDTDLSPNTSYRWQAFQLTGRPIPPPGKPLPWIPLLTRSLGKSLSLEKTRPAPLKM